MCLNPVRIFNKYTQKWLQVPCGSCDVCLQQKADRRATRIVNHEKSSGKVCLFVTLTYDNRFIPYIRPSEIVPGRPYNIYRDAEVRYVRSKRQRPDGCYYMFPKVYNGTHVIGTSNFVPKSKDDCLHDFSLDHLPLIRKRAGFDRLGHSVYTQIQDKVSVSFFKDWQDFYKRFEINYVRTFGERPARSYYVTSEYGETFGRIHFHSLIWCDIESLHRYERIIRHSWQYNGNRRYTVKVEVARKPAAYVASYVNSGVEFPKFLRRYHAPKNSYSQGFGMDCLYFSLDFVASAIERGSLLYPIHKDIEGHKFTTFVPFPRYVLNRWFPYFAGRSALSPDEVYSCCEDPEFLRTKTDLFSDGILYDEERKEHAITRLHGARRRFREYCLSQGREWQSSSVYNGKWKDCSLTPRLNIGDFPRLYVRLLSLLPSFFMRSSMEEFSRLGKHWCYYYTDLDYKKKEFYEYYFAPHGRSRSPIPDNFDFSALPVQEQSMNFRYKLKYDKNVKQKKVTNLSMVSQGYYV